MSINKINVTDIVLYIYIAAVNLASDGSLIIKLCRLLITAITILYILKSKKIFINGYEKWAIIFSTYCFLSIYWAESRTIAFSGALTVLWNAICTSCVVVLMLRSENRFHKSIKVVFFSSILYGLLIFTRYGFFIFLNQRSIGNISANEIGIRAAIGIIFGIMLLGKNMCNKKIIYILGIVINLFYIILSASRKALLLLLIPIGIYFIFKSKKIFKVIFNIIITIFLAIVVYQCIMKIDILYAFIGNRIETMINGIFKIGNTDGSTEFRLDLIKWGIEWFKDNPVLGHGIDNFRYLLGFKSTWTGDLGTYAHNNFIELAVDVGILGFIIYYFLYYKMIFRIIKNFKNRNIMTILSLGIIIALLINEYGLVTYSSKDIQVILAIIWVIIINNEKKYKGVTKV